MNFWTSSDFPAQKLQNYACRLYYSTSMGLGVVRGLVLFALHGADCLQQRLIVAFLVAHFFISFTALRTVGWKTGSGTFVKLLYSETLNFYFLYQAFCLAPQYKLELCISAFSIVGSFYQIAFISSPWTGATLIIKQVVMWVGTDIALNSKMADNWISTGLMVFYLAVSYVMLLHIFLNLSKLRAEMIRQVTEKSKQVVDVLESIQEGMVVLAPDSVLLCNKPFYDLFAANTPAQAYLQLHAIPLFLPAVHSFFQAKATQIHFGIIPHDNKQLEWLGSKVTWNKQVAVILTCRDVTELLQLQDLACKENERKIALMRSISHELRTPMNYVRSIAEEIGCNGATCKAADMQVLYSCCNLMNLFVDEIQDFAQVNSTSLQLSTESIDLKALLNGCLNMVKPYSIGKDLDLSLTYDPSLAANIVTDPGRLRQLLVNLLTNAIKYTNSGSVRLVAMTSSADRIKIQVEDSGIGIEKHRLADLLTCSSAKSLPTSGIGLFMAGQIAFLLGRERLSVESKLGQGSTFAFFISTIPAGKTKLPRTESIGSGMLGDEEEKHSTLPVFITGSFLNEKGSLRAPEVLIVDDFPFNRMVVRVVLEKEGLSTQEAENGSEAIALVLQLHSKGLHYRLIVMDFDMPGLDGFATTKALLELKAKDSSLVLPPIIGHSAYTSDEDRRKCLAAGMAAFLPKPCGKLETLRLVETFLMPRSVL